MPAAIFACLGHPVTPWWTLAKGGMASAALAPASGSCINCTFLNDVRVNRSQAAAGEVFSHFNFAPTPVLGPSSLVSGSDCSLMRQAWKLERHLAMLVPRQAHSCWVRLLRGTALLVGFWRCWCYFPSCLEAWWVVYKWSDANRPQWSQLVFPGFYSAALKDKLKGLLLIYRQSHLRCREAIKARQTVMGILFAPGSQHCPIMNALSHPSKIKQPHSSSAAELPFWWLFIIVLN